MPRLARLVFLAPVVLSLGCNTITGIDDYAAANALPEAPEAADAGRESSADVDTRDSGTTDTAPTSPDTSAIDAGADADAGCPTHSNGLGQTYVTPCAALGTPGSSSTYTIEMAQAACNATSRCAGTIEDAGGEFVYAILGSNPYHCVVWSFSGSTAGHLSIGTPWSSGGPQCASVTTGGTTWD